MMSCMQNASWLARACCPHFIPVHMSMYYSPMSHHHSYCHIIIHTVAARTLSLCICRCITLLCHIIIHTVTSSFILSHHHSYTVTTTTMYYSPMSHHHSYCHIIIHTVTSSFILSLPALYPCAYVVSFAAYVGLFCRICRSLLPCTRSLLPHM
jgi:hypothetical protein